jgi:hypothetical protein
MSQQLLDSSPLLPRPKRHIQARPAIRQHRPRPKRRHDSVLHPALRWRQQSHSIRARTQSIPHLLPSTHLLLHHRASACSPATPCYATPPVSPEASATAACTKTQTPSAARPAPKKTQPSSPRASAKAAYAPKSLSPHAGTA